MLCVLDSSVALAWVLPGEGNEAIDCLLADIKADQAVAPALWLTEIGNTLLLAERRGRISSAQRSAALQAFGALPIEIEAPTRDRTWRDAFTLAAMHRLTLYDSVYLEAALRLSLPLATLDVDLGRAAEACGIPVPLLRT